MCSVKLLFLFGVVAHVNSWVLTAVNYTDVQEKSLNPNEDYAMRLEEMKSQQDQFNLIFPGTKWCGSGDDASSYDDLGSAAESDACCRDHDHCPDIIPAGETKYKLTNTASHSRLSCICDEKFRRCLRRVNSKTSTAIGTMYFNIIGTQCYKKDHHVVGCNKYGGYMNTKCLKYEYDSESEKRYQWFDVPSY